MSDNTEKTNTIIEEEKPQEVLANTNAGEENTDAAAAADNEGDAKADGATKPRRNTNGNNGSNNNAANYEPAVFPSTATVLRMRGLPYSSTDEEIREFFGEYELAEENPVVIIAQGFHRGEGYVNFKNQENACKAHGELNRKNIGDRYIELYPSTESAMEIAKQQQVAMVTNKNSIIRLRGLPFTVTEQQIRDFFADEAEFIAEIQMCVSMDGRPTGDAFVELTASSAVETALEKNRQMIGQRYIEIFDSTAHERDILVTTSRRGRGKNQRTNQQMILMQQQMMLQHMMMMGAMNQLMSNTTGNNNRNNNNRRNNNGNNNNNRQNNQNRQQQGANTVDFNDQDIKTDRKESINADVDNKNNNDQGNNNRRNGNNGNRQNNRQNNNNNPYHSNNNNGGQVGGAFNAPMMPPAMMNPMLNPMMNPMMMGAAAAGGGAPNPMMGGAGGMDPATQMQLQMMLLQQQQLSGMGGMPAPGVGAGFPPTPPMMGNSAGNFNMSPAAAAANFNAAMAMMNTTQMNQPRPPSQFIVRVRGLPFAANEGMIAEFFHDVNIPPAGVHMVYNAQERPTGEAFVEVMTENDVQIALEHNGAALGHRYIEVFRSSDADMNRLAGAPTSPLDGPGEVVGGADNNSPAPANTNNGKGKDGKGNSPYSSTINPYAPVTAEGQQQLAQQSGSSQGGSPKPYSTAGANSSSSSPQQQTGAPQPQSWASDLPPEFEETPGSANKSE